MAGYTTNALLSGDYPRKLVAWNNASPIPLFDANMWRQDCDGRIIKWDEYGQHSTNGWEIDHIVPVALGGGDAYSNLRARHWLGNSTAGGILGNALNNGRR